MYFLAKVAYFTQVVVCVWFMSDKLSSLVSNHGSMHFGTQFQLNLSVYDAERCQYIQSELISWTISVFHCDICAYSYPEILICLNKQQKWKWLIFFPLFPRHKHECIDHIWAETYKLAIWSRIHGAGRYGFSVKNSDSQPRRAWLRAQRVTQLARHFPQLENALSHSWHTCNATE